MEYSLRTLLLCSAGQTLQRQHVASGARRVGGAGWGLRKLQVHTHARTHAPLSTGTWKCFGSAGSWYPALSSTPILPTQVRTFLPAGKHFQCRLPAIKGLRWALLSGVDLACDLRVSDQAGKTRDIKAGLSVQ